jgi:hypothetical protein
MISILPAPEVGDLAGVSGNKPTFAQFQEIETSKKSIIF